MRQGDFFYPTVVLVVLLTIPTHAYGACDLYADSVVDSSSSSCGCSQGGATSAALGAPDYVPADHSTFYSLTGTGQYLTVEFTDNYLLASGDSQADLKVYEPGSFENYQVYIRPKGETSFIYITQTSGDSSINIDQANLNGNFVFDAVKLVSQGCQYCAGPDIDAVECFNHLTCENLKYHILEENIWEEVAEANEPDPNIYKHNANGAEVTIYSANPDCDGESSWGETVDMKATYTGTQSVDYVTAELDTSLDANAICLKLDGWDETGEIYSDDNDIWCQEYDGELKFNIKAISGQHDFKLKITFWSEHPTEGCKIYKSSKEFTIKVQPNQGDSCCNEKSCELIEIQTGGFWNKTKLFCGYDSHPYPDIKKQLNGDLDVLLPNYKDQYFIMDTPNAGFLSDWKVEKSGTKATIAYESSGEKWYFKESSPYKLIALRDMNDVNIVEYEYDAYDRLIKQSDAIDANYYIAYDYNDLGDFNDVPEIVTVQADDVNRIYAIEYDEQGRAVSIGMGTCGCSGAGTSVSKYVFDGNDNVWKELNSNDDVMYEYIYDSQDKITEKWLGAKDSNDCIYKVFYSADPCDPNNEIADTYTYFDANNYMVKRQYRNSAGFIFKEFTFNLLNEDPCNAVGDSFVKHTVYYYDSNNVLTKRISIPASVGDANDPDPNSISGIRREYVYDPNTGRLLTERWFDVNDVNILVIKNEYEYLMDGGEIADVRLLTTTDIRGGVTSYGYDGDSTDPNLTAMPKVTIGVSGTVQQKYRYTKDSQGRLELEEILDDSNSVLVKTKYEYDSFGNLKKRYDAYQDAKELVAEYQYNGFGEMTKTILPTGVQQGSEYGDSGKVIEEYLYDPCDANYVYSQTSYFYDSNGLLEETQRAVDTNKFQIDNPDDDWIYTEYYYDLWGRKTKTIEDANGLALETYYEYNHQGQAIKTTLPNGKWTKTEFNGRGFVKKQIVGYQTTDVAVTEFEYDENGNLGTHIAPNKVKTKYEYDDFDRIVKITRGK